jgi:hypothetical protein
VSIKTGFLFGLFQWLLLNFEFLGFQFFWELALADSPRKYRNKRIFISKMLFRCFVKFSQMRIKCPLAVKIDRTAITAVNFQTQMHFVDVNVHGFRVRKNLTALKASCVFIGVPVQFRVLVLLMIVNSQNLFTVGRKSTDSARDSIFLIVSFTQHLVNWIGSSFIVNFSAMTLHNLFVKESSLAIFAFPILLSVPRVDVLLHVPLCRKRKIAIFAKKDQSVRVSHLLVILQIKFSSKSLLAVGALVASLPVHVPDVPQHRFSRDVPLQTKIALVLSAQGMKLVHVFVQHILRGDSSRAVLALKSFLLWFDVVRVDVVRVRNDLIVFGAWTFLLNKKEILILFRVFFFKWYMFWLLQLLLIF